MTEETRIGYVGFRNSPLLILQVENGVLVLKDVVPNHRRGVAIHAHAPYMTLHFVHVVMRVHHEGTAR